jgi:hypothetical protein
MDPNVPYMPSITNLHRILDKIQNAGVPEVFNLDFLRDLGFTSSNDRAVLKVLKYLGMLDSSGKPQSSYRQFMDHTQAKAVLATRLRLAYDDLFLADREANTKTTATLKGWFKTKTGESDSVAEKIASTFKSLASYADFAAAPQPPIASEGAPNSSTSASPPADQELTRVIPPSGAEPQSSAGRLADLGFVYRLEIHLPDTQNVETFRAIFKALREEMMS